VGLSGHAVNPCGRYAVLLRWQVQGSPSVASPFGRKKRHRRFSCSAPPLEARQPPSWRLKVPPDPPRTA